MHGIVTVIASETETPSDPVFPVMRHIDQSLRGNDHRGLHTLERLVAGVLIISALGFALFSLIDGSGNSLEIMSSEVPSFADIEDWLMGRGQPFF